MIQIGEVDSDKIQAAIQNVVSDFNIFRVKGFAALPGKPMRQVLQAVGKRLDSYFDRPWQAGEPRKTSLVFIGKGIEKAVIQSVLENALV
ncbi:hypothetical protein A3766_27080 [Oleiphilus sp. HI0132]|uniref:GTP-binding protein n=1 Tax=Oleiphilus sp. HI0132 TaxID=1822270 RepID=UPI0007C313E0|nr:GTP-binding protein [Oleiphilus sp. HI0132]KZY62078.1 hypothetical protein A3735_27475 [Oleiphilus sp. HI0061]KZZ78971.1 hypothetical protein A3766_27080 [Oleiphilus sp. HI0132]